MKQPIKPVLESRYVNIDSYDFLNGKTPEQVILDINRLVCEHKGEDSDTVVFEVGQYEYDFGLVISSKEQVAEYNTRMSKYQDEATAYKSHTEVVNKKIQNLTRTRRSFDNKHKAAVNDLMVFLSGYDSKSESDNEEAVRLNNIGKSIQSEMTGIDVQIHKLIYGYDEE